MRIAGIALLALTAGCASVAPHADPSCPIHIRFAGLDWSVSDAAERFPGAAKGFAWNECNVRLEPGADGGETLVLTLRKERGGWRGAQIESEDAFQYGTFSMTTETPLRPMVAGSPSAVFGFFTYVGPAYANEIDIEFTRWGNPGIPPVHYTVWHNVHAGAVPSKEASFTGGADAELVRPARHVFVWTNRSVTFERHAGSNDALVARPFTVKSNVPTKPMHIMLNLWVERQGNMGSATAYEVRVTSVTHTAP